MIISTVGSKSWKTRTAYGIIFALLILGAITMIYPLLLMLAGSVTSEADSADITPYPRFWFDDAMLFRKYVESKHNVNLDALNEAWGIPITSWRKIDVPTNAVDEAALADFRAWRETPEARNLGILGHTGGGRMLPINARLWRKRMEKTHDGDLAAFCEASGTMAADWTSVVPPAQVIGRYRHAFATAEANQAFEAFKASRPARDFYFRHPDALRKDTPLEEFLRRDAPIQYIRLAAEAEPAYRAYLARRHPSIAAYNTVHHTTYTSFDDIPFVQTLDDDLSQRIEWEEFLRSPDDCPVDWITLHGPEESCRAYRADVCGRTAAEIDAGPAWGDLVAAADAADCSENSRELRREFTKRNYLHVLDYIALHGNGIVNTIIYCLLAVATALVVNPLAAYALSRFNLPATYQILLFCMATMAFPAEVSMIPSFILLKRFPLWPLVGAIVAMAVMYFIALRVGTRLKESARVGLALAAGFVVGALVIPLVLGPRHTNTSLLNTFAALVLPGAANGYSIFLLKGFFDAMPRELYEAADLDGASEWTKFWTLTIHLSKPILAVIALNAFTAAYSAFMMALIVIPDPAMWTLMVWIFQLQSYAHGSVVYASIVIAAIPTFLVFAFCQNIIIRGIVVPTEK
ncbi:MAG: carbohydrate ABC transporter permease [Kiritimatiellia bacterium]|jgi:ABC-type glycerol-3-phosphate transport system permease component